MSNMQTLAKNLRKKTVLGMMIAFSLSACTQTNSAPIRDVSERGAPVYKQPQKPQNEVIQEENNYTPPPSIETQRSVATQAKAPVRTPAAKSSADGTIAYQRDYNEIPKGGYNGDAYTVQRGDTLFYIAWITGNDFRELARRNNINEPYALSVGQTLDVSGNATSSHVIAQTTKQPSGPVTPVAERPKEPVKPIFKPSTAGTTASPTKPTTGTGGKAQVVITETVTTKKPVEQTTSTVVKAPNEPVKAPTVAVQEPPKEIPTATATVGNISWQWPARGRVIVPFSASSTGNKGIDIEGTQGQDITAAASGSVVYAGNALPGYGNLIIIKHNDDYLTAYAHNDKILVQEQQSVKAGQRIATMGKTGTSSTRLHFEIRYQAKSVDPMRFLPR